MARYLITSVMVRPSYSDGTRVLEIMCRGVAAGVLVVPKDDATLIANRMIPNARVFMTNENSDMAFVADATSEGAAET